jgi:hypothetical protein
MFYKMGDSLLVFLLMHGTDLNIQVQTHPVPGFTISIKVIPESVFKRPGYKERVRRYGRRIFG